MPKLRKGAHVKRVFAIAAVLAVSGCAHNAGAESNSGATTSWSSVLDEKCSRCVSSKYVTVPLDVPLPKRAIIYGFTGEFATKTDTWIVNLDTGEIIQCKSASNDAGKWKQTVSHLGNVDETALGKLRAAAANLWTSERYNVLGWDSPGAVELDQVISGARLVAFSRFAPNDRDIVSAINSALPANAAATNGSYVVRAPKQ